MSALSNNWKVFFTLLGVALVVFLLWFFRLILLYFICAVVLSFIAEPIADLFKRVRWRGWMMPAWARAILALVTLLGGTFAVAALFAPVLHEEIQIIGQLDIRLLMDKWGLTNMVQAYPQTNLGDAMHKELGSMFSFSSIQSLLNGVLSWVGNLVVGIVSVLFITFFFLKDGYLFTRIVFSLTPEKHMQAMKNIMEHTHDLLRRYFIGVALQSLIMSVMISVALYFIGVKNALLIGLFAGMVNVIPYVGPVIGALFALLVAVTTALQVNPGADVWSEIWTVVIVFGAAQQIDGFVVQPLILGNSVKAHPLEVFVVVLMAGMVGGIFGMIAAIPVYTIFRVIAREFFSAFKPIESLTRDL